MAYNKDKELKLYYSIGEVAQQFGVAETLLRFWEKEFPQIAPKKSGRNIRQYTKDDIEQIRLVYNLVKVRGLKISAARELLRKNKEGVMHVIQGIIVIGYNKCSAAYASRSIITFIIDLGLKKQPTKR
jgi:DNA-binding transcriptional MerR regulator